jgi:hypothetical protein
MKCERVGSFFKDFWNSFVNHREKEEKNRCQNESPRGITTQILAFFHANTESKEICNFLLARKSKRE